MAKKKKATKVKRSSEYDLTADPEFHEEAVLMDHDGNVIGPVANNETYDSYSKKNASTVRPNVSVSPASSGVTVTKVMSNVPEHLSPLVETNDDRVAREQEDKKELAKKIADVTNSKKLEHVEKPAHIQKAPPSAKTEGQKIWAEIKNLPIEMFGLPNKRVHEYCKPLDLVPSMCFLTQSFSSVLPMLEAAIGQTYVCEMQGKYIVVKRAVKPL